MIKETCLTPTVHVKVMLYENYPVFIAMGIAVSIIFTEIFSLQISQHLKVSLNNNEPKFWLCHYKKREIIGLDYLLPVKFSRYTRCGSRLCTMCCKKVPPVCLGSTAAAVQPNGLWNSRNTFYKPLCTTCCHTL